MNEVINQSSSKLADYPVPGMADGANKTAQRKRKPRKNAQEVWSTLSNDDGYLESVAGSTCSSHISLIRVELEKEQVLFHGAVIQEKSGLTSGEGGFDVEGSAMTPDRLSDLLAHVADLERRGIDILNSREDLMMDISAFSNPSSPPPERERLQPSSSDMDYIPPTNEQESKMLIQSVAAYKKSLGSPPIASPPQISSPVQHRISVKTKAVVSEDFKTDMNQLMDALSEIGDDLQRLPIPPLKHTEQLYLQSCKPHFESEQQAQEYTAIVKDFFKAGGLAESLQARLAAHDKTQKNSWLESWWLKYAYLSWRNSVLVHSNWFVLTQDLVPSAGASSFPIPYNEGYSAVQVARAAGFANSFLDYKDLLDREELAPETTKSGYLDMSQYTRLFGVTRVPKPECDILVGLHPCKSQHIILLVKDQIFVVHVYDQKTGARISDKEMERQFQECINRVQTGKKMQAPIGILSGQHRDKWAEHHGLLLQSSPKNAETFALIESAIFAVALDDRILPQGVSNLAKNVFHGIDGHNRWFDKSLTIVVSNDGRLGVHGEHSPCDALVPAMLVDFAVLKEAQKKEAVPYKSSIKPVQRLEWVLPDGADAWFQDAQKYINETISDSDLSVLHYNNYGADFIKKVGRVSPDAYSQLCLQLTFYRIHGYFAGVYETASARQFLHGRTETCRSLTYEAAEFIKTFQNPSASANTKYLAFQKAAKAHIAYITKASSGMGVDRHLLGLKLCMQQGESHPIYTHPIFAKSSKWQLSTSALFSGERLVGTGFGTVYPDGYGMNYMLGAKVIKIGVESKVSCPETSTLMFIQTLSKVYDDVGAMCKAVNAAKL